MNFFKKIRMIVLCSLLSTAAYAGAVEEKINKHINTIFGMGEVVDSVSRTDYSGLYEVVMNNGEIIYTDEKTSFIIQGNIVDTRTRKDITKNRMIQISQEPIDFSKLPLEKAMKEVRGNGERVLVTFEDPNCMYCKQFLKEFADVDNVTLYTFIYPILGEDSQKKSRDIWCAEDRLKSWKDWMYKDIAPESANCNISELGKNYDLGMSLKIRSVPTLFFADGSRLSGFIPANIVENGLK